MTDTANDIQAFTNGAMTLEDIVQLKEWKHETKQLTLFDAAPYDKYGFSGERYFHLIPYAS